MFNEDILLRNALRNTTKAPAPPSQPPQPPSALQNPTIVTNPINRISWRRQSDPSSASCRREISRHRHDPTILQNANDRTISYERCSQIFELSSFEGCCLYSVELRLGRVRRAGGLGQIEGWNERCSQILELDDVMRGGKEGCREGVRRAYAPDFN